MTLAEIQDAINKLDTILKGVNDQVNQVIGNALVKLVPIIPSILQTIHDAISNVSHTIETIAGAVSNQIGGAIGSLVPGAVDFFVSILKTLGDNIGAILGNLATAEEFVASAIGELKKHAPDAAGFLLGTIGGGLSGGMIDAFKFMEGEHREPIDQMLDHILNNPALPPFMKTQLTGVRQRGAPWMALLLPLLVAVAIQPLAAAAINPAIVWARQESNKILPENELAPQDATIAYLKGVISEQAWIDALARHGINKDRAFTVFQNTQERLLPDVASRLYLRGELDNERLATEMNQRGISTARALQTVSASRPLLGEDQIRQTFLRGIIDRPKHDQLMAQHGYTQERIDQMVNLYFLIPGPQDLIHMGIRNVFDDNIVKQFQLAQDAPPEFFAAAAHQGISQDWALKYWEAHWIVPGIDEAFRMYQRVVDTSDDPNADTITLLDGTKVQNIIGAKTLNLFLKDKDVPPYYRAKITQTAYHPLNRIDVRRMFSVGSLDKAGVQRAYLNLGYSPDNALLLADFVEKFYAQARKDKAQPIIDGLRKRILTLYEAEKIDLSDASFALTDLGFTKEEADYFLAEVKLVQQAADSQAIEAGIGRLVVQGFITPDDATARLALAKVPNAAIVRLLNKWAVERELKQDSEHFHKVRDLTKAEVTEAYADQLMTEKDASDLLVMLGYPDGEAEMLLHLANYRRERTTRLATQDAIKALYVSGVRDVISTSNALDALALPAPQRDALLAEWGLLRETRTEKLPIATLRDMLKGKYLSRVAAFSHLKRHRYTDDDAILLLDYWQGVKPQGA